MITYPQFLFLFLFSLWDIVSFKFKCFTEIVVSFRTVNFCTVPLSFMLYSPEIMFVVLFICLLKGLFSGVQNCCSQEERPEKKSLLKKERETCGKRKRHKCKGSFVHVVYKYMIRSHNTKI